MVKSEKSKCFVFKCLQTKEKRPVAITSNGTFFIVLIHTFLLLNSAGIYYKDLLIRLNTACLSKEQAQKRN